VHEIRIWADETAGRRTDAPHARRRRHRRDPQTRGGAGRRLPRRADRPRSRRPEPSPGQALCHLPGVSGSGKTLLARLYARAVHGIKSLDSPDPLLSSAPCGPSGPTRQDSRATTTSCKTATWCRLLEALLVATAIRTPRCSWCSTR
jgi:hypothetical protein